jgi:outer membrane protein TolC
MHDIAFIDPTSYTPYVLPRDAYRVTFSVTLNDILFSPAHSQALVELEKLREMLATRRLQQARESKLLESQLMAIKSQIGVHEKELALVQELLRFNQLRFDQGKIEFDVLTRTKIELLSLQRSLNGLHHQQSEIQLKLTNQ